MDSVSYFVGGVNSWMKGTNEINEYYVIPQNWKASIFMDFCEFRSTNSIKDNVPNFVDNVSINTNCCPCNFFLFCKHCVNHINWHQNPRKLVISKNMNDETLVSSLCTYNGIRSLFMCMPEMVFRFHNSSVCNCYRH